MNASAATPWSAQQREWLRELGHEVLVLGAVAAPVEAALEAAVESPAARPPRNASPAPRRMPAVPPGDAALLLQALLRAARRDAVDAAFAAVVPDPTALRGDAAAKRALWPRLRALRRAR